MNDTKRLLGKISLLALGLCLTHCRKESEPEALPGPARSAASAAPAVSAAPPDIGPLGPSAAAEQPFPGQDLRVGKWVETSAYKFRVNRVQRCAEPVPKPDVPEDRPLRVGVHVDVFSRYDQFLLAPRDISFEKGGVIIDSEKNAKASAGCAPLLDVKRMKHDEVAGGVVIFQLPDESFAREGSVVFYPTRWGGAPRAEVKVTEASLELPKTDRKTPPK